ncbi:PEP-CTERM sorting domain-containing protein [Prosthecobacter fluviatilis]|uniref:PEP-CTERM sorting domain-containing protein n=1 Tax=Prosthecobacter fluviatilis TaxID=445931 RepID=A0ABW0KL81_9BACT
MLLPFGMAQALTWDEGLNGDLSDDGAAPTLLGTLSAGSNLITGTMGALNGAPPLDADIWNFTIAPGYYLTGINLVGYSSASGSLGNDSFMAIANGGSINLSDPSQHLSNALWGYAQDGFGNTYNDLLMLLDLGPEFGGIGFDGPLPSGNYTFWIQEGSDQINYSIDFVTTPVPVPEPGSLMLLGVAGLWMLRRRR